MIASRKAPAATNFQRDAIAWIVSFDIEAIIMFYLLLEAHSKGRRVKPEKGAGLNSDY